MSKAANTTKVPTAALAEAMRRVGRDSKDRLQWVLCCIRRPSLTTAIFPTLIQLRQVCREIPESFSSHSTVCSAMISSSVWVSR